MELKILETPLPIDPGATMPEIIADENNLSVSFHLVDEVDKRGVLNFSNVLQFTFGYPNEEAINGHRYHKLGLMPFMFVEVLNSEIIKGITQTNRIHPYHKDEMFAVFKHYVFPFHDTTLEVIAKSYEFEN